MRKNRYGFLDEKDLDEKILGSFNFIDRPNFPLATTDLFNHLAKNHCGATMVTNLCLYFYGRDKSYANLLEFKDDGNVDLIKTFIGIHKYVKNGPILFIRNKAIKYFKSRGVNLNTRLHLRQKSLQAALDRNNPTAILLMNNLFDYHWVLSLGYGQEVGDRPYYNIIDNWYDSRERYIKYKKGNLFIYAVEFEILR